MYYFIETYGTQRREDYRTVLANQLNSNKAFQEKKEEKIGTHKSKQNKNSNSRAKQRQEELLEAERRKKKVQEQTRESVKRLREKRREENRKDGSEDESTCLGKSAFKNRMAKTQALQKTVEVLSQTAAKKAEIFVAIASSLRTRKVLAKTGLVKTPEEVEEMTSLRALAADISESTENIKTSKSKDDKAVSQ